MKKEVKEIEKTKIEDMPGPKKAENSLKEPRKSGKMGIATSVSQKNIQENTDTSTSNMEDEISATSGRVRKTSPCQKPS